MITLTFFKSLCGHLWVKILSLSSLSGRTKYHCYCTHFCQGHNKRYTHIWLPVYTLKDTSSKKCTLTKGKRLTIRSLTLNNLSAPIGTTAGESATTMFVNSSLKLLTSVSFLMGGLKGAPIFLDDRSSQYKFCKRKEEHVWMTSHCAAPICTKRVSKCWLSSPGCTGHIIAWKSWTDHCLNSVSLI